MEDKKIYSKSIFVDSGAHTLYNELVLKHRHEDRKSKNPHMMKRLGKDHLDKPPVRWSQGDFSEFDLRRGTPFRQYCDRYASFMKRFSGRGIIFANVDAISNPDLTWEIQKFFEEEHGIRPTPIIHCGTPMGYVERYLSKKYKLLGVGGLGQGITRHEYFSWADEFFMFICPESNNRMPLIRTHGFAMTSWELICRYPWWSVDSATWVKLSAYGWLYVPRWSDEKGWRFDRPPLMLNFSFRSPRKKEKERHYDNATENVRKTCDRWLKHIGLEMGSVDEEGETKVFGVTSHHRARSTANLRYLIDLQDSRPKWPHPLNEQIIEERAVSYKRGFGL
jgi:hypothetical protein